MLFLRPLGPVVLAALLLAGVTRPASAATLQITSPSSGMVGGLVHVTAHASFSPEEVSCGYWIDVSGAGCINTTQLLGLSGYPGDGSGNCTYCWDTFLQPPYQSHAHGTYPNGDY